VVARAAVGHLRTPLPGTPSLAGALRIGDAEGRRVAGPVRAAARAARAAEATAAVAVGSAEPAREVAVRIRGALGADPARVEFDPRAVLVALRFALQPHGDARHAADARVDLEHVRRLHP